MLRRISVAVLLLAGAALIGLGIWHWIEQQRAGAVVEALLAAMRKGNCQAALALFTPDARKQVEQGAQTSGLLASPQPFHFRVYDVALTGDSAAVTMWISRDGYVIKPVFRLRRLPDLGWRITAVDPLSPPAFSKEDDQSSPSQTDQRVFEQLETRFDGHPGVTVKRAWLDERSR